MSKILIIEDDYLLADLYQDILSEAGFDVLLSADAQSGVDQLDEYGADLILLDLMLPAHNGIEFLQELRSYTDWQDIPVIVFSAAINQPPDQNKFKELGVSQFLYKDQFTPKELVEIIKQNLKTNATI